MAETKTITCRIRENGRLPQCEICSHYTERTFSATDKTHNIETREPGAKAFLCVSCWSDLAIDEDRVCTCASA